MKLSQSKSSMIILLAAILWGTTGSSQSLAPDGVTPFTFGALRMLIGGLSLLLFAFLSGKLKYIANVDKKLVLLSAFCMAFYQPLFFLGVSRTGIALGTALALGSAPIFCAIIEVLNHKTIDTKWLLSTSISILGCLLLFAGQGSLNINILGSIFSLGAGLSYAIYVKSSHTLFESSNRILVNGLVFLTSALILSPILFANNLSWVFTIRGASVTFYIGVIATALAYTLFAYGLTSTSTPRAVTLTLAEPLTAMILGVTLFDESITFISVVGALLLLTGLIINTVSDEISEIIKISIPQIRDL